MPPTVFVQGPFRFFFNSREETRLPIHVESPNGVAKFWLEPLIALADYHGVKTGELTQMERMVREQQTEFIRRWHEPFGTA